MSRTRRNKRPLMHFGYLDKNDPDGKVRDGTPQHASGSCHNHGGCPVCEGNRLHNTKKRMLSGVD